MANIEVLDKQVWGKIAAGEVVEKPASIVKELVENSIDANAKNITIEIKNGGKDLIYIQDDGFGIKKDQIEMAFIPHATSKLRTIDDLYSISSMGFRGEALASIAAVSVVEMITKTDEDEIGHKLVLEGGDKKEFSEIACLTGTNIKVENLFFNTPARAKFLRKTKTEENDITSYVEKLMLSHSDINFKYIVDDKLIYNTTNCSIIDIIYTIYGKDVASNMIPVNYKKGDFLVSGYVSKPVLCKSNRTYQSLFINNRYCINSMISASISNAYDTFLMKGKFPVYVLFLTLPKDSVDVNVHPNKLEVKFENTQTIYGVFNSAIYDALARETHILDAVEKDVESEYNLNNFNSVNTFNNIDKNEGVSFNDVINNNSTKDLMDDLYKSTNDKNYVSKEFVTDDVYNDESKYIKFEQSLSTPEVAVINTDIDQKQNESSFLNLLNKNMENEKVVYDNLFKPTRMIIGVAFNTYIIVQEENNLYFIDQHAAHERELFDKFMGQVNRQDVPMQDLLVPYLLNLNDKENEFIENNLQVIKSQGFGIDEFGKNCYRITTIPMLLNNINLKEYFDEVLSNLNGFVKKPQEVIRHNFATMACKAAVKGGNNLSMQEINILLDQLKENNTTLLCPHGRPIVITLDRKQIEKMFKRIV